MIESTSAGHVLVVDTSGSVCPGPVVQASKAVRNVEVGQAFRLVATDPGSWHDIPAWCRVTGHELAAAEGSPSEVMPFTVRRSH